MASVNWSPLTESNRRPSPYHGHAAPPSVPSLHRQHARNAQKAQNALTASGTRSTTRSTPGKPSGHSGCPSVTVLWLRRVKAFRMLAARRPPGCQLRTDPRADGTVQGGGVHGGQHSPDGDQVRDGAGESQPGAHGRSRGRLIELALGAARAELARVTELAATATRPAPCAMRQAWIPGGSPWPRRVPWRRGERSR